MAKVSKGRDGRKITMFSSDEINSSIYNILQQNNLNACEKWMTLPLPQLLDQTGLPLSDINFLKSFAAKKLCPEIVPILSMQENVVDLSFGSRSLDEALNGVLKEGTLLEIWGSSGCGKSQLALQMCVTIPSHLHSAYISTEGIVPTSRLAEISEARGNTFVNCDIQTCNTVESFSDCVLKQLPLLVSVKPIKLIIVDSIAAPFRAGEVEGGGVRRAQIIRSIGQQLKFLASQYKLLVVVLNQATDSPTKGQQPALGMTWSYLVNSRLRIEKFDLEQSVVGSRRVVVEKASCIKSGTSVKCTIQKEGFL